MIEHQNKRSQKNCSKVNEATLTRSRNHLKLDSVFHIQTWYSTPSIPCKEMMKSLQTQKKSRISMISERIRWRDNFQDWETDDMRRLDRNFRDSQKILNLLEDSLVSVTKKEANQKYQDMDSSVRLEEKSVLTSKIDLYRSSMLYMYKA